MPRLSHSSKSSNHKNACIAAMGLALVLVSAGDSFAEGHFDTQHDHAVATEFGTLFSSFGAGAMVLELPEVVFGQTGWAPATTGTLFAAQPDIATPIYSGTLGYILPEARIPSPFGRQLRVEISGVGWSENERSEQTTQPAIIMTVVSVDNSRQLLFGSGTRSAQIESRFSGIDATLRMVSDYELGTGVKLSPSLGVVGGKKWQKHMFDISAPFAAGTLEIPIDVVESLDTLEVGAELGAEISAKVTDWLRLRAELRGALIHSDTHLAANDCLGNPIAVGGACDGAFYATSVEADRQVANYRVVGSLGATVSLGLGDLSFSGFGGWESAMAGIRNPTAENRVPTSIKYDESKRYGGFVSLSIPLRHTH